MEFRNIYSFLRAAELGSFTKAAQELGYAQSTITTQIQQLESELGFPLFEHIGRRIDLTVHGREVIRYANQILHIQEQILDLHHTAPADIHGTLRIGIVESIMHSTLLATIKTYQERFPNVQIQIFHAVTAPLFEMLRRNEVDLVFTLGDLIDVPGCVCACRHQVHTVFVSSPEHPMAQQEQIPLADVLAQPLILTGEITFLRRELAKIAFGCGIELNPIIQTESSSTILRLVAQNLGIAFLGEYMVRCPFYREEVTVLPVTGYSLPFYTYIFYHKSKYLNPQMAGLIRIIEEYWKELDQDNL